MSSAVVAALRAIDLDHFKAWRLPLPAGALPNELFLRRAAIKPTRSAVSEIRKSKTLQRESDLPDEGTIIDKYRLERVLGIGGFGVVYRARHIALDTVVAMKLMRPSVARAKPGLPRLLREEARFAAKIDHDHVVRVYDVTTTEDLTYIIMEYVDGPDLSVMIKRRGALPSKMVLRVVRHVAIGLEAGLDKNLIHRDVKPSNILLTRSGTTKLADFGLARSSSAADPSGARGVVGTIGYMSPEQLDLPTEVDFRSDIYSLGVTTYQSLTGQLPFSNEDPEKCADAHRFQAPVAVSRLVPTIPAAVNNLVTWMMAKRREERPQSYKELIAALDELSK
jgi:serine/threonine-protein kinase